MTRDNCHDPTQKKFAGADPRADVATPDTAPDTESRRAASVGSASVSMTTTSSFSAGKSLADPDLNLPSRLQDRYEFRSLLGVGGFGAVFEAWDEVLQRSVAIKLARRERFEGTSGRQRFLEEARAVAKLKHPHLVTVFDSGSDADGNPFVVFELISGESLAERMKRQPMSTSESVTVMVAVADAVHAAHKHGLIHRDLKPPNILLDSAGQPHVTDFGLAVDEHSQREMAGEVAGSPQYMSPEQIRGETQYLDGRTDIWSLGVILYELLARRRPFSGRDLRELCDEIQHREPKPIRQMDESVSIELEEICLRCLRKKIAERWTSAAELATRLRQLLMPSQNVPASVWRSSKFQTASAVALLILLTTLVVIAPRFWPGSSSPTVPPTSEPRATQAITTNLENPESAGITDAQSLQPVPGKWFPLLHREPERLLWPADARNSECRHDPVSRELWVTCGSRALLKLGDASGDFEIQFDLHQSPWVGNVGLFLGLHDEMRDGVPVQSYQSIELMCPRDRKGQRAFLNRVQVDRQVTDPKLILSRKTRAIAEIPDLGGNDITLRVKVSDGRLSSVRWNGQEIPDLVAGMLDPLFPQSAQHGAFGIALDQSSVMIRHAEFLTPFGENQ